MGAVESVYGDVKENINNKAEGKEPSNSVTDIIVHASVNAGVSALFTAATGGDTPVVNTKKTKIQNVFKHVKDCLLGSAIESPASSFSSEYAKRSYSCLTGGFQ